MSPIKTLLPVIYKSFDISNRDTELPDIVISELVWKLGERKAL